MYLDRSLTGEAGRAFHFTDKPSRMRICKSAQDTATANRPACSTGLPNKRVY